ncbi:hypothetical protein RSOLAG22IIIB_05943 [Rhizoctonia solani]|uniref:Uncharacterized protein n=1 Tax=Rhizoctonia solani TaxID=456999 RepID=A0A0K6GAQ7_9AGAM|nr:hypothetical protein RSOLAG22IIIB_05943 [Rhizoctonia solani]
MGLFDDADRGHLEFEEDSETSSNIREHEEPGPAGQAAPATGSAFDYIDMSNIAPRAALLAFVEGCSEELMLSDESREIALQTAKLPLDFMVMRLFTHVLEQRQDNSKTKVEDFLLSPTFKTSIKRRIQGGLLDPHIPFYVRGYTARFVRHMRQNPASYELPLVVQKRLLNTKKFSSAVGEILSSFRGELRRKIFASIEDKADISSTAEKLAIEGYLLSEDHIKQFALLRQLSEDYIKSEADAQAKKAAENLHAQAAHTRAQGRRKKSKVDGAPQKALAFWTYIDAQMHRFQQYTHAKRTEILKKVLRNDRKKYPDPTGQARYFPPANRLLVSQWQADATQAIQAMAEYTLTAAQEGQDAPPTDPGPTQEGEGLGNQEDLTEEEDGPPGEGEEYQSEQGGMSRDDNLQGASHHNYRLKSTPDSGTLLADDPSSQPDEDMAYQYPDKRDILDGTETAPGRPRNTNSGSALGSHISQCPAQPESLTSVGPIRTITPGPLNGTLAQNSRNSPFPLSLRTSTRNVPRLPALGAPNITNSNGGGATTRSKTAGANSNVRRLPVVEPYNPVGSDTAAASVGR